MRRPLTALDSCPGLYEALRTAGWEKYTAGIRSPHFFRFHADVVENLMAIPNEDIPRYLVLDVYDAGWPIILDTNYLHPTQVVGELKQFLRLRLELC